VTKKGGVVVWVVGDATIKGSETGTSFKQALWAMECGFNLHDTMFFEKASRIPTQDRYYNVTEYMFVFSKGKPKTFNPIKIKCKPVALFKNGRRGRMRVRYGKKMVRSFRKTLDYKIKGNIWEYATGRGGSTNDDIAFEHPAIFPENLVADHIRSWSNEGELVCDFFMGSGTVAKVASVMNRNWIGSDIERKYCDITNKRIEPLTQQLFNSMAE